MRILIVEDEDKIAQFLKTSFEAESFATDVATTGTKGCFMAATTDYDLIVLDYMLPEKTGVEVCQELRAKGKKTPIMILSVTADTSHKADLLDAGADDYMTKPFSLEELMARARALLRRPQEVLDTILTCGTLRVDVRRYRVTRNDHPIYLTPKEFALLEYLLRNKGVVLSRPMILEHVWDEHADPFSNTIESHILSLRKKIDVAKEQKLIHTVPGRGYVIDDKPLAFSS